MRRLAAVATVLAGVAAFAQEPAKPVAARYGVAANATFYPQGSAKELVATVAKAMENRRYEYAVAHLLDPAFVDGLVADRARKMEPEVEKELIARRADRSGRQEELIPFTPAEFAERLKAETERRAFQSVVQSVRDNLAESPENVRLLAKFAREGVVADTPAGAAVTLKDVNGRQMFLKQTDGRWFLEDRQTEDFKPKAAPPEKAGK